MIEREGPVPAAAGTIEDGSWSWAILFMEAEEVGAAAASATAEAAPGLAPQACDSALRSAPVASGNW